MEKPNIFEIYKYGDAVLKEEGNLIKNINGNLIALIEKMKLTMYNTQNAIGLAAPQVGHSLKLSVFDISMGQNPDDLTVLINPVIAEEEGEEIDTEGCLSFPNISLEVKRSAKILLKGIDLNGNDYEREYTGFPARVIQHETDHLNGILIADHISSLKKQLMKKDIRKLKKNGEW